MEKDLLISLKSHTNITHRPIFDVFYSLLFIEKNITEIYKETHVSKNEKGKYELEREEDFHHNRKKTKKISFWQWKIYRKYDLKRIFSSFM